ncbi:DUF7563 family protein [Haladaptatus cibarius]|uniref:DUF7563 family protein n=1 Tax=Haladaptatus cibarius TaxID=453847 RepID=UPI00130E2674|nr:hypothetical protein [Haladaptatus cibarius]
MAKAEQSDGSQTGIVSRKRQVWRLKSNPSRYVTCQNPTCKNDHVDPKFVRMFGAEGVVFACPECTPWGALKHGAAASPTFERRVSL